MRHALLLLIVFTLTAASCDSNEANEIQAEQTEQIAKEVIRQIGIPNIVNFTEAAFAKQIQELRDQEVTTYSYFMDMNGQLHFVCESVGYGLPYSVQFTNPQKVVQDVEPEPVIPQREPNGLFMPDNVAATWILCSDGDGGVRPVYSEPNLVVSPFRLNLD